ncbi:MAG: hypothetical protein QW292_07185 [Candidatus Parvarchaeota archaeon]
MSLLGKRRQYFIKDPLMNDTNVFPILLKDLYHNYTKKKEDVTFQQ